MKQISTSPRRKRVCRFKRPDGQYCQAKPLRDSVYCFWHDPSKSDARRDAGRIGGLRGRARTLSPDTPDFRVLSAESVVELLSKTVNQTLRGEVDPKVSNAVGYLSSVILRAREQGEIEERIAKIEEKLKDHEA